MSDQIVSQNADPGNLQAGPAPAPASPDAAMGGTAAPETSPAVGEEAPDNAAATGTASGPPESYADFTVPDGLVADPQLAAEFKVLAKECGLPQEAAQQLVDLYAERVRDLAESPNRLWQQTQGEWRQQARSDREIGGARFAANVALANKAVDTFGGPALRQALGQTGAGNHPEVIRFFCRVGNAISEDAMVAPHSAASRRSTLDILFPNFAKE